jgi:septum formation protein
MKLILASASTARRSMLENAGYRFETVPSTVDETPIKEQADQLGMKMSDLALRLALAKAQDIAALQPNACVIGSDQVLECEGNRFSKVSDLSQAHEQLARLQGKSHHLHSAVAVCCDDRILFQHVETAQLDMWPMSDREIDEYLQDTGAVVLGSVGCYQIEGKGVRLFSRISGDQFTIMGMPLLSLIGFLRTECQATGD